MNALVHLELHTSDERSARTFCASLLHWPQERIHVGSGSYLALGLGGRVGGGIVECGAEQATWLPYVAVRDVNRITERAVELGASLMLEPREGPAGWRSVVCTPHVGELAFWQAKR